MMEKEIETTMVDSRGFASVLPLENKQTLNYSQNVFITTSYIQQCPLVMNIEMSCEFI